MGIVFSTVGSRVDSDMFAEAMLCDRARAHELVYSGCDFIAPARAALTSLRLTPGVLGESRGGSLACFGTSRGALGGLGGLGGP